MGEACKDCIYVKDLKEDVEDLKDSFKELSNEVNAIKVDNGRNDEKFTNFDKLLNDISKDVKEIKQGKQKFITGIISGVTITVIAAFILQALKIFHW